jgi:hypothetical protein
VAEAFPGLTTSTSSADHRTVATSTTANTKLTTQLEVSQELIATIKKEMKDLNVKMKGREILL